MSACYADIVMHQHSHSTDCTLDISCLLAWELHGLQQYSFAQNAAQNAFPSLSSGMTGSMPTLA